MSMTILGLATAAPAQSIEQSEAARIAQTFLFDGREARLLPALFRRTQVHSRGSVVLESRDGCGPSTIVLSAVYGSRRIAARQPL